MVVLVVAVGLVFMSVVFCGEVKWPCGCSSGGVNFHESKKQCALTRERERERERERGEV